MMKLGKNEIGLLNAFSSISGVNARDCMIGENTVCFVVKESEMGNAIGKKGAKVQRLMQVLKKNVELFPYNLDPKRFLSMAFQGISFETIDLKESNGKKVLFAKMDAENRRKIMQRAGKIKRIKELAKRNYEIEDIKIR